MSKVELKVVKPWIAEKINAKLGFEDDVLIQYIYGMLEEVRSCWFFSHIDLRVRTVDDSLPTRPRAYNYRNRLIRK
jgi:hypothetical protein